MTSSRVENSSSRAARKVKLALMGPAFVAAIGYIDPGNFATNIQAGASFGYQLLWVVVWANLMAMLIQVLSAKLGIATGKNLAEQIRDHYPRPVVWFYWVQAEIIAMATDLAEFIGAAIGFKLVLGVSLLQGAVLTGVATFLILMLQRRGQKPLEKVIGGLLLFVAVAYVVELIFSQPALAPLTKGLAIPTLPNGEAVFLAAGVLGATIMPLSLASAWSLQVYPRRWWGLSQARWSCRASSAFIFRCGFAGRSPCCRRLSSFCWDWIQRVFW